MISYILDQVHNGFCHLEYWANYNNQKIYGNTEKEILDKAYMEYEIEKRLWENTVDNFGKPYPISFMEPKIFREKLTSEENKRFEEIRYIRNITGDDVNNYVYQTGPCVSDAWITYQEKLVSDSKIKSLSERNEFLEDLIAEISIKIYN